MGTDSDGGISPEVTTASSQAVMAARLDRKRASDRRAQRAARERRQNHISSLTRQIELLSGLPHDHVNELFRLNGRLRAENETLKKKLADLSSDNDASTGRSAGVSNVEYANVAMTVPVQIPLLQQQQQEQQQQQQQDGQGTCLSQVYFSFQQQTHNNEMLLVRNRSCSPTATSQPALYKCLPVTLTPATMADQILADFKEKVRASQSSELSATSPLCPSCPDIWLLCSPRQPQQEQCLSVVVMDIISTYPNIVSLRELAASFLSMFKLLRWQFDPTLENYNQIPEWQRPTPTQLRIAHPPWMDRIQWPGMRSYLVSQQDDFSYEEFSAFYRQAVSVSWPYSDANILISCVSESCKGKLQLNPVFEQHVSKLESWVLKDSFVAHFPVFRDILSR